MTEMQWHLLFINQDNSVTQNPVCTAVFKKKSCLYENTISVNMHFKILQNCGLPFPKTSSTAYQFLLRATFSLYYYTDQYTLNSMEKKSHFLSSNLRCMYFHRLSYWEHFCYSYHVGYSALLASIQAVYSFLLWVDTNSPRVSACLMMAGSFQSRRREYMWRVKDFFGLLNPDLCLWWFLSVILVFVQV